MVSPWTCIRCILTVTMFACFLALVTDNMALPRSMQGIVIAHSEEQAAKMCKIEDRGCLKAGTWVQRSGPKEEEIFPFHEGCSKKFFHICAQSKAAWKSLGLNVSATGAQDFRMRRLLSWLWVPANVGCNLSSRSSLLEALSGRRVLLIGDSIAKEHYVSLRCLVGDAAVKDEREHFKPEQSVVSLHGGGFIQFYRLNTFVQESTDVVTPDWPSQLVHEADVVILNTGAHKHARLSDGQNRTAVAEMARTVAKTLQSQNQRGVFIFRSHFLPHASCEEVTAPISSLGRVPRPTQFNWHTFADQDEEWRNAFERSGPRFLFYNITLATSLRADAHTVLLKTPSKRDCLHFCLPGVVDLWSLYTIVEVLQKLRSCQSVEAVSLESKNSLQTVVISHCDKPLAWIFKYVTRNVSNVTVVSKCNRPVEGAPPQARIVRSRNVGRCDHTYAQWLAQLQNHIPPDRQASDLVLFIKDNDMSARSIEHEVGDHAVPFDELLAGATGASRFACGRRMGVFRKGGPRASIFHVKALMGTFQMDAYNRTLSKLASSEGEPFKSKYRNLMAWMKDLGIAELFRNQTILPACYGGNFMTSYSQMVLPVSNIWQRIETSLSRSDSIEEGHFAERSWAALLSRRLTLQDEVKTFTSLRRIQFRPPLCGMIMVNPKL
ncbi:Protein trichome birefringence-like 8 [Symbiodinium microadriaticum]|uniref:Protein trichome birefringence-like 8 n=1 Tax=Symbiodinium microadriaticum TaxID=2951 RepID=A0A1Q9CXU3_SYMMI|nr:Protein trichome birefringence-like 8 [Symbiodinium microadriaticum]CAE7858176.1 TBL8 [Symbiodinium microadriaticum]CAE7875430.1 TBL8 [Symbiodinium sp. KB8]